jgi:hypothetical protein
VPGRNRWIETAKQEPVRVRRHIILLFLKYLQCMVEALVPPSRKGIDMVN